jgi:hypothetical protein
MEAFLHTQHIRREPYRRTGNSDPSAARVRAEGRGRKAQAVALSSVVVDLDQVRELALGAAEAALDATSPKSRLATNYWDWSLTVEGGYEVGDTFNMGQFATRRGAKDAAKEFVIKNENKSLEEVTALARQYNEVNQPIVRSLARNRACWERIVWGVLIDFSSATGLPSAVRWQCAGAGISIGHTWHEYIYIEREYLQFG